MDSSSKSFDSEFGSYQLRQNLALFFNLGALFLHLNCAKSLEFSKLYKKLTFKDLGQARSKELFAETTIDRIFEKKCNFHVKEHTTGKFQFPFLSSFLLVLVKCLFWEEDWALDYNAVII